MRPSYKSGKTSGKKGNNIRGHALSPNQIAEIVKKNDDPSIVIYQTNRTDKNGNDLPNNVAVFVEYNNNGSESVAVIEFDILIDQKSIGTEFGDIDYHTVVTVFEPDSERNGVNFDYAEELLSNPDNYGLNIERRQPEGSATGANQPNTSNELPSGAKVSQEVQNVKPQFSISDSDAKADRATDDSSEGSLGYPSLKGSPLALPPGELSAQLTERAAPWPPLTRGLSAQLTGGENKKCS